MGLLSEYLYYTLALGSVGITILASFVVVFVDHISMPTDKQRKTTVINDIISENAVQTSNIHVSNIDDDFSNQKLSIFSNSETLREQSLGKSSLDHMPKVSTLTQIPWKKSAQKLYYARRQTKKKGQLQHHKMLLGLTPNPCSFHFVHETPISSEWEPIMK